MTKILFYVPNLIGYARLLLLAISCVYFDDTIPFLYLYSISIILDGFDGYFARKLNQISAFGAWLDVVIDNLGRTMLWCFLHLKIGFVFISIEWLAFVCLHTAGPLWKTSFSNAPFWVAAVMAKGFKTLPGILAIAGLNVLPLWLYKFQYNIKLPFNDILDTVIFPSLVIGRLLCMAVELWCIQAHIGHMIKTEEDAKKK
ncbi:CDP-diacylglycerol--inositol 3-phosphatidyltransferase [Trichoplax sp. H2]|nr:CDP-diacylglycerol--inositol 3-phosphatidyltransferase [Trichoplax sp. H2]|eukprot:RDD38040.1 CDP-diacylglycerol--inositol 3-phosphatidyltransferase [Trichoplax sp. H2]